jgi:alpha,alpha-trehalase
MKPSQPNQFFHIDKDLGQLFATVQMSHIFPDSKTFTDSVPKYPIADILSKYSSEKSNKDFDLKAFIFANFTLPQAKTSDFQSDTSKSISTHLENVWALLSKETPTNTSDINTAIPLPHPYIVPGGRFEEIYYWDSYFTMLGLKASGRLDMIENMINNFAYMIDTIGHIPNGNRSYYISRSQPPFFTLMVELLAEAKGEEGILVKYLPQIEKEYQFWMRGKDTKNRYRRVVRLQDSQILNRYWDNHATPRPESYREDIETATEARNIPRKEVYRHIRAAAESGWDFSSRWFADDKNLNTINTTHIIPIDLNCLLFGVEQTLRKVYKSLNNAKKHDFYAEKAKVREAMILKYCWQEELGFFMDYNFVEKKSTQAQTLATVFPLFFKIATQQQADKVAKNIEQHFLQSGGVVTSLNKTGQQWDAPNGWSPLQWMTIVALRNYGHIDLANTIKHRWLDMTTKVYQQTGKMMEKYNVMDTTLLAGGGEYENQDGFGWTNGVILQLLKEI